MTEACRAFIGLPVEGVLAKRIESMIPSITVPEESQLRLSKRENWHVTLHFFGDKYPRANIMRAWHDLKPIITSCQAADIIPRNLVGLPMHHSRAWVITIEPTSLLLRIHDVMCKKLDQLGFAIEDRPYFPHITLWRPVGKAKLDLPHQKVALPTTTINSVVLYESHIEPSGSVYEILDRYPLR